MKKKIKKISRKTMLKIVDKIIGEEEEFTSLTGIFADGKKMLYEICDSIGEIAYVPFRDETNFDKVISGKLTKEEVKKHIVNIYLKCYETFEKEETVYDNGEKDVQFSSEDGILCTVSVFYLDDDVIE